MALNPTSQTLTLPTFAAKFSRFFTVKKLTLAFAIIALLSAAGSIYTYKRIQQIEAFNKAVLAGEPPESDQQSFEAKFATALYLAKKERYKESILLFSALMPKAADNNQKSAVQYNIGNISFLRGLAINGNNMTVKAEAEYLVGQAKVAYINSLKLDNSHWDAKHNLDRVLGMLPSTPTPGVGDGEKAGLIMGNVPVGLP
jgi:mxaK protein